MPGNNLLGLAVKRVFSTPRAIFFQLHPVRVITTILLGCVVSFLAYVTGECDDRSDIFLF